MGGFRMFSLGGIDVSVSLTYLLLMAYYVLTGDPLTGLIWVAVITLSIIVHEFGHALVARHYRLNPSIVLWGLGGLCFHENAKEDRDDAFIIIAGPGAGLIFGVVMLVAWQVVGSGGWPSVTYATTEFEYWIGAFVYVNIFWSLVNLLPVFPLDGGQLFRLFVARKASSTQRSAQIVHGVGAALSIAAAVYAISIDSMFLIILSGILIWENIQVFIGGRGMSGNDTRVSSRQSAPAVVEALEDGERALAEGNYREAARLGHVARSYNRMSAKETERMWRLLGLGTAGVGEYDEALAYLERAPDTPDVLQARQRCRQALDQRG